MSKNNKLVLILLVSMLPGCGTMAIFPQNRVLISDHEMNVNKLYSFSYPAKLRASSVYFALSSSIPAEVYAEYGHKQKTLLAKKQKLNALPPKDRALSSLQAEIMTLEEEMRLLVHAWMRPRILAEPPPDVAESMKLLFDVNPAGETVKNVSMKIDAGTTLAQIKLSTESDVKRHLMYRLNEALFNEPEAIIPMYEKLFTSIINLQVPSMAIQGAGAETSSVDKKPDNK